MSELLSYVMERVAPYLRGVGNYEGAIGILVGTYLGYFLSACTSERHFRRTLVRDIAFEYRKLARPRRSAQLPGLILAGICQCKSNREYADVLDLVDDLAPDIDKDGLGPSAGDDWRPANGNYVKFFMLLKKERRNPSNGREMRELKERVENGFLRRCFRKSKTPQVESPLSASPAKVR